MNAREEESTLTSSYQAPTILCVTQQDGASDELSRRLERYPHSMTVVNTATEMLDTISNSDTDLIILDGDTNLAIASEICNALDGQAAVQMLPILMFTKSAEEEKKAEEFGVRIFVSSLCNNVELIAAIKRAMAKRLVVLHIDDDPAIHEQVAQMLDNEIYCLVPMTRSAEALMKIGEDPPDIIICDLEMPDINGLHLCRYVKQSERTADIPFVICSGLGSGNDMKRGFEAGADDYMTKPFTAEHLNKRIMTLTAPDENKRIERILVVDEVECMRNLVMRTLRHQGFQTKGAATGKQALDLMADHPPDLIVCELEMTEMDGREFTLEVRKNPRHALTPILIASSTNDRSGRARCLTAGASDFIVKPFSKEKLCLAVQHLLSEGELKRERAAVRHYLSDAAIEIALKQIHQEAGVGSDMRADYRFMTVLFVDVVGFTGLCERMSAKEVATMLNSYFDLVVSEIRNQDGLIDKFIGDCVMALFGRVENGAYRAARFGLELIKKLEIFNQQTGYDIQVRIGINSGNVLLGDLGSKHYRRDYTVIGDGVNIAQRLEQLSPVNSVMISDVTYQLIRELASVETQDSIRLKGMEGEVTPHILRSLRPVNL